VDDTARYRILCLICSVIVHAAADDSVGRAHAILVNPSDLSLALGRDSITLGRYLPVLLRDSRVLSGFLIWVVGPLLACLVEILNVLFNQCWVLACDGTQEAYGFIGVCELLG